MRLAESGASPATRGSCCVKLRSCAETTRELSFDMLFVPRSVAPPSWLQARD